MNSPCFGTVALYMTLSQHSNSSGTIIRTPGQIRVGYGDSEGHLAIKIEAEEFTLEKPRISMYDHDGSSLSYYGANHAYIYRDSDYKGFAMHGKTDTNKYSINWTYADGYGYLHFYVDTTEVYTAQYQAASDRRVKTDIEPIRRRYKEAAGAVDIDQFRYDFNDNVRANSYGIMFGVIAQDLIEGLENNGIDYEDTPLVNEMSNEDETLYSVDYTQFLLARLAYDEDRIKELETRLEALESA